MKKIVLFAAVAAAMGLASCTSQAPKASFKGETDSLSYMLGIANTEGLVFGMERQFGIDSLLIDDFLKGFLEGVNKSQSNNKSYNAGYQIGQQVGSQGFENMDRGIFGNDSTKAINKSNFLAGFADALQKKAQTSTQAANDYVSTYVKELRSKQLEEQFGENKAAGEKFLAENAKKEGVVTTESGLQYKIIKAGKGEIPTKESTVKVHYKGTLIDGTEFDSSYSRKEPAKFGVTNVIKGWTEALQLMPVGSKWELYIPQELAYGERQSGSHIKPFSALVFEVELLEIEKKK
mgnify:CR=1 FL=1